MIIFRNFALLLGVYLCLINVACAGKHSSAPQVSRDEQHTEKGSIRDMLDGLAGIEGRLSELSSDETNFVLGYANFKRENWKDADGLLSKIGNSDTIIKDHIFFFRAVSLENLGRHQEALDLLNELKRSYKDSVWTTESDYWRAKVFTELKKYPEANAALSSYKKAVSGFRAFDADRLSARIMIEEGNGDSAANQIRSLILSVGSIDEISELGDLIDDLKKKFGIDLDNWMKDPETVYRIAVSMASHSQWDDVVTMLTKIVNSKSLGASERTDAKWLMAKGLRFTDKYDEAIKLMEELKGDASGGMQDEILQTLSTTYTKKNDYQKAIALRTQMMERAPKGSKFQANMAYKIAFLYMDESKYDEAIRWFQDAMSLKLGGKKMVDAKWYLAWCHYMKGQTDTAIHLINEMLASGGNTKSIRDRLLYWKGRFLLKAGQFESAFDSFRTVVATHPGGYYAVLATRKLAGKKVDDANFGTIDGKGGYASNTCGKLQTVAVSSGHLSKAATFDRIGVREEAAREIRASGTGESLLCIALRNFANDVAYAYAEGRYRNELKTSFPDEGGMDDRIWEAAFPRAYETAIKNFSGSMIDPKLAWAIMRNESAFKPEVVSSAGAVGLMQLMPATAKKMVADAGLAHYDRRDIYKPEVNIALGVSYLKKLSGLIPNNPAAWVAAYNAGELAVMRWLDNGKSNDIEEWIEEIPYDETNLYVKKVMLSYWKYQLLYGNN